MLCEGTYLPGLQVGLGMHMTQIDSIPVCANACVSQAWRADLTFEQAAACFSPLTSSKQLP